DFLAQRSEKALDGARRALLQRASMDWAKLSRHRIPGLEVLRVHRTVFDRAKIRHTAQFDGLETIGNRKVAGGPRLCRSLHEIRPDRQGDACTVSVAANRGGLIEADPHAGHHRARESN